MHALLTLGRYVIGVTLIAAIVRAALACRGRRAERAAARPVAAEAAHEGAGAAAALAEQHLRPLVENGGAPGLVYAAITSGGRPPTPPGSRGSPPTSFRRP